MLIKNKGFTLIELLIVIAIIGILVSVALPSYQSHVRKANRVDAQMAMSEMSLIAERQYARQGSYPTDSDITSVERPDSYEIVLAQVSGVIGFTITATPQGSQANDDCGTMTLNQVGAQTAATSGCW